MRKNVIAYFLLSSVFLSLSTDVFALRNNDFTRSNKSYDKKYSSDKSTLNEKRSYLQERGSMEKMKFVTPDNADYLRSQKAYTPDNYNADSMSKERGIGNRKKYDNVPEYAGKTDDWYKAHTELHLDNTDRDMSKKYLGKIDTTKRNLYEQEYLRDHYAEMLELSMQDINKFYFRETHSSDPGIPMQVAGGQIGKEDGEDGGSILDFLSTDVKIDRPSVSLRGPKPSRNRDDAQDTSESKNKIPLTQPQDLPQSGMKVMPPVAKKQSDVVQRPQNKNPKAKVAAYEEVPVDKTQKFDFMKIPEEMRGETIMKVEVQDNEF